MRLLSNNVTNIVDLKRKKKQDYPCKSDLKGKKERIIVPTRCFSIEYYNCSSYVMLTVYYQIFIPVIRLRNARSARVQMTQLDPCLSLIFADFQRVYLETIVFWVNENEWSIYPTGLRPYQRNFILAISIHADRTVHQAVFTSRRLHALLSLL